MRSICVWAAMVFSFPLAAGEPQDNAPKHIFWFIPDNRESPSLDHYKPLTWHQKFRMATADAIDPGNLPLAIIFAGQGLAGNSNPSFGHGAAGFARYFGAALGDQIIGDYMGEAVFPSLLHQDPRYFRLGSVSFVRRFGWAALQLIRTHDDAGRPEFNYSNILGAASAVGISNLYYRDNRGLANTVRGFAMQFTFGLLGNLMTEFWPDIHRKLAGKKSSGLKSTPAR